MRFIIVIVLIAAVAYYVWNDEKQQLPRAEAQQVVEPDEEGGIIEEHLLAPLGKAQNFKDEKYPKALEEHQAEIDAQDQ